MTADHAAFWWSNAWILERFGYGVLLAIDSALDLPVAHKSRKVFPVVSLPIAEINEIIPIKPNNPQCPAIAYCVLYSCFVRRRSAT